MRLRDQLPDVLLLKFYIHSMYVRYLSFEGNFNVLMLKIVGNFAKDIHMLANLLL